MPDLLVSIPDDTRELPADVLVPAARISDSTAAGRSVITAADAAAIRTAIGMTAAGSSVATAADAAAQRTALGMTAAGSAVVTAADAAAQLTALGAQPAADLDDDVAALAANPASALGAGLSSTIAAAAGGSDPWTYAIVTSATTTTSITPANINGLAVPALADGLWEVEGIALGYGASATEGAMVGLGAGVVDVLTVDWQTIASVSAGAAVVSLLTSLTGLPEVESRGRHVAEVTDA